MRLLAEPWECSAAAVSFSTTVWMRRFTSDSDSELWVGNACMGFIALSAEVQAGEGFALPADRLKCSRRGGGVC